MVGIEKIVGSHGLAFATYNSRFGVTAVRLDSGERLWTLGEDGPHHLGGNLYFAPPSRVWIEEGGRSGREPRDGLWSVDALTGEVYEKEHMAHHTVFGVLDGEYLLAGGSQNESVSTKTPGGTKAKFERWPRPPLVVGESISLGGAAVEAGTHKTYQHAFLSNSDGSVLGLADEELRPIAYCNDLGVFWGGPIARPSHRIVALSTDGRVMWEVSGNLTGIEGVSAQRSRKVIWSKKRNAIIFQFDSTLARLEDDPHDGVALCCRDMDTGDVRWAAEFNSKSHIFDAVGTGDIIWVALGKCERNRAPIDDYEAEPEREKGRLVALSVVDGKVIWEKALNAKKLIVVDGNLVVSTGGGIVCLESSS